MKTITQLQDEKFVLESRLRSITSYYEDGTPYYIDKEIAEAIQREIDTIEQQIENLGIEFRNQRLEDEENEQVIRRSQRNTLVTSARSFYEKQLASYMQLSLWKKAKAMFTGKKPKVLTDREILEIYGRDALEGLIDNRIAAIMQDRDEQIAIIADMFAPESKEYRYAMEELDSIFEDKIERTRLGYESELESAIKSSSPRKGMR